MHVLVGAVSRHGPDRNPLLKRLVESMQKVDPGIPAIIQVEIGPDYTKAEKRQRLFVSARARGCRFACVLEDDTELIQAGWLQALVSAAILVDGAGIVNPLESRDGATILNPVAKGRILEAPNLYGFCMLYSLDWAPRVDPRITFLDDLEMSLQCRAAGYRLAVCGRATVRHSKEPFLRDNKPPWEQKDRERWGDGNAYYDEGAFTAQRVREAAILLEDYGDMAEMVMPPELLKPAAELLWRRDHPTLEYRHEAPDPARLAILAATESRPARLPETAQAPTGGIVAAAGPLIGDVGTGEPR